ncbi:hypothetical protein Trydic_g20632, partial [Trypoxylus dichotomus]
RIKSAPIPLAPRAEHKNSGDREVAEKGARRISPPAAAAALRQRRRNTEIGSRFMLVFPLTNFPSSNESATGARVPPMGSDPPASDPR